MMWNKRNEGVSEWWYLKAAVNGSTWGVVYPHRCAWNVVRMENSGYTTELASGSEGTPELCQVAVESKFDELGYKYEVKGGEK